MLPLDEKEIEIEIEIERERERERERYTRAPRLLYVQGVWKGERETENRGERERLMQPNISNPP